MSLLDTLDPARGLFVGGRWTTGSAGRFDVDDPADGRVIATVANGGPADATAAVDAADAAAATWAATPPRERSQVLHRAYELMMRDRDDLAALIVAENGKSRADALSEVAYAAEFLRWYGEEAVRVEGRYGVAPAGGSRTVVTYRPVGVAALVTPWNFPAAMATRKVGPALAAGCTVVFKPAAETPLTAFAITRLLTEAGLPAGVVNVVPTTDAAGVVTTWLEDPRVRKISFTGSTRVGKLLLRQAADRVVNASMELGGNAPFVVTADADLDAAVRGAMVAKFRGCGQVCVAANRFYVHADVVDEFVARFGKEVEALRVGPSSDAANAIGPLISPGAVEKVTSLVDDALARGARIAARAAVPAGTRGYFVAPTVLADVPADADVVREEIFGPVAPIVTWRDPRQMLTAVNASEAGLAAYVFAGDLQYAMRLGESIEAGMVGINRGLVSDPSAPFGGVKQSGLGREGSHEGLHEFTEPQTLSLDWPELP
ncbi:NAD-dependent succinate-semialdehyde dehydrogenase [Amycolatopsis thermophila]|uniref:Succinate-semialdehyde dehydrogenase/glutarate-semialdehyde dehydrogenase n=1 Tax=Amycolatopsis thermophila TaxID=206084 RepID=A0ABU0F2T0_9PSEU|nr:NAD-dependent succinate-semialdehyde dehydrogenase [Amycolatopsis thermophila]MDQ0381890.1 succinate-semialdehyde dehydrogenase/glutarate-semialdehyde dehydrogenase [Amycolatopsis thermophila]